MTPHEAYQLEQERVEQQDAIAQQLYLDGVTDGAFGYKPQYTDDEYLKGYCEGIKKQRCDEAGRILWERKPTPFNNPDYTINTASAVWTKETLGENF